jgi:hypothetical protein
MKTALLSFLLAFYSVGIFSQNDSKITELKEIQNFCKSNFENSLWFDYDECDLNSVQFFLDDVSYEMKLSSLESLKIDIKERRVAKNKSNAYTLVIKTYPSAKIKKSYHVSGMYFVFTITDNGLSFIDELQISGNKEEIETLKEKLEKLMGN